MENRNVPEVTPEYNNLSIESKWRNIWNKEKTFAVDMDKAEKPYYNLMMFPYPSAEGLHVGNFYAFTGSDINGRYHRIKGYDVFEPMGWDAFGIHSENYAKKIGSHPLTETPKNVANFKRQFSELGALNDWDHEINTTSPEYYRWNQWLFLKLFEKGLAYKQKSLVNWCPECQTVISNEQVVDGKCERHGDTDVEKKEMEQWFLKITDYAESLYSSLDNLNWSDRTKVTQKNWIGQKEGFNLRFKKEWGEGDVEVFTTRIDTIHGVSFIAISCDSDLAENILTNDNDKEELYKMRKEKAFSRKEKDKVGILSSIKVIHPLTGEKIPVYIANYVEGGYGTGAVMGVPSYDDRDRDFALNYNIPFIDVYKKDGEDEVLVNSGEFSGLDKEKALEKVSEKLEELGVGEKSKQYKLRDWCISRQRYWGTPIPMVNCKTCGLVPEKAENLPIKLPIINDYKLSNDGKSPLSLVPEFVNTKCPCCGGDAERETDVMDNFFDSAWYFFRYLSPQKDDGPFDLDRAKRWLPINTYIGGNEHAVLHLMYTRFMTKFLKDLGLVDFDEPFSKFFAHGLIIKDGKKMSKSKGNVINPDDYIKNYGADSLRTYLMFLGPLEKGGDFTDSGIVSIRKFLGKIFTFLSTKNNIDKSEPPIERKASVNNFIQQFDYAMENYKYNVAISKIMVYFGELQKEKTIYEKEITTLLKALSIFAPYLSEELWNNIISNNKSVHEKGGLETYQNIEGEEKVINLAVQIGGKLRGVLKINQDTEQDEVMNVIKDDEKISQHLNGKTINRVVYVKGKIINLITN